MTHHKRSRVGRLPRWQRLSTHLIFSLCALSGLLFFLRHELALELAGPATHSYLVAHGVSAAFALLAFGAVLPGHVRAAWNARRNRASGVAMIGVLAALMGSGLLLYYGGEEWREGVVWTHWVVGFLVLAVFPLHLLLGSRGARSTTAP
ncbi:MAG: hypothetical protein RJA36_3311 [Pseudomonadota bacterium]|jgi:hypothetical protein